MKTKDIMKVLQQHYSHDAFGYIEELAQKLEDGFLAECQGDELGGIYFSDIDMFRKLARKALTQAHQAGIDDAKGIIESNRKGAFTDDAGHNCWYVEDLLKALNDTIKALQDKK